jgi:hypothetical protein
VGWGVLVCIYHSIPRWWEYFSSAR